MRAKNVDLKVKANGTVIIINWNSEGEGWGGGKRGRRLDECQQVAGDRESVPVFCCMVG